MSWVYSACSVCQRRLSELYFIVVTFWHFLFGAVIGILYLLGKYMITGEAAVELHSTHTYMLILLLVLLDFCGVNAQAIAFSSDASAFVSIIGYMIVFYGYLIDQFYFHEPITGYDLLGAIIIFSVSISVAIYKLKLTDSTSDSAFKKQ
jgi:drug/metabolite transporter (DMT)-like permease